jgi:tRNA (cmo5U34)-methyltransferase
MTSKDNIYATAQNSIRDFTFDKSVVEVFPDMIQRSVPGYTTIISTIGELAKRFHQPGSNIYDLGCSLGAATSSIRRALNTADGQIIAVDNSPDMVERCNIHVSAFKSKLPVNVQLGDIVDTPIENASLVVLNFTLQFIAPDERQALLSKICDGINPGGALILSEKIKAPDPLCDEVLIDLHHHYKRVNGYSELEISQKRSALENVMKPQSLLENHQLLKNAGFGHTQTWYQCFNFSSMIAIKSAIKSPLKSDSKNSQ